MTADAARQNKSLEKLSDQNATKYLRYENSTYGIAIDYPPSWIQLFSYDPNTGIPNIATFQSPMKGRQFSSL